MNNAQERNGEKSNCELETKKQMKEDEKTLVAMTST
jgi:hypothetical protein